MKRATSMDYPPGPTQKLPLVQFLNFLRDPIGVLVDISRYGHISHFKFGNQHIYFLSHPDYIRDVLVTYDTRLIKSRGLQLAKKVLGEGLLTRFCPLEVTTSTWLLSIIKTTFYIRPFYHCYIWFGYQIRGPISHNF
jgi:hypothetical protein